MKGNVETFSIIVGGSACNARCPFCISKMTPTGGVTPRAPEVNWQRFLQAARLARGMGSLTAMLTGKGEPTLWPDLVDDYMDNVSFTDLFPVIELQTNAIPFATQPDMEKRFEHWAEQGLTTVAISVVHWDNSRNREIYLSHRSEYPPLVDTIRRLHSIGLSVRLAVVMLKDYIDDIDDVLRMVSFAQDLRVEQLTVRPVNNTADKLADPTAWQWTEERKVPQENVEEIYRFLRSNPRAHELRRLHYGASIFDFGGQNLCVSNCLTVDVDKENIRQLIVYPDGHVRYDWQFEGAIIF